jgi:hypothetical protein
MTKQNKNRKEQATLEQMVKSGSQLVLMRDDGSDEPVEALAKKNGVLKLGSTMRVIEMDKIGLDGSESDQVADDPYANESTKELVESKPGTLAAVGEDDGGRDQDQSRRCLGMQRLQRDDQPDGRADLQARKEVSES